MAACCVRSRTASTFLPCRSSSAPSSRTGGPSSEALPNRREAIVRGISGRASA
jgi:hypothetical protein